MKYCCPHSEIRIYKLYYIYTKENIIMPAIPQEIFGEVCSYLSIRDISNASSAIENKNNAFEYEKTRTLAHMYAEKIDFLEKRPNAPAREKQLNHFRDALNKIRPNVDYKSLLKKDGLTPKPTIKPTESEKETLIKWQRGEAMNPQEKTIVLRYISDLPSEVDARSYQW